ncbi:hypothetical protein UT300018_29350 [Clostridium faecium]
MDKFYISVTTNGVYLNKVREDLLKKIGFVQVSMYGTTVDEYKFMTGSSNAFYGFQDGLRKLYKYNIDSLVTVVLNQDNINNMERYVSKAYELGATKIKFGLPAPLGRAIDDNNKREKWNLNDENEKFVYNELMNLNEKYKNKIKVIIWEDFNVEFRDPNKEAILSENYKDCLGCGGGWLSLNVSEYGRITPCQIVSPKYFDMGSLDKLEDIVNGKYKTDWFKRAYEYNKYLTNNNIKSKKVCTALEKLIKNKSII